MEAKHANLTLALLAAADVMYDFWMNPHLPGVIPSHWNINGQADGFSPKWFVYAISLIPLLVYAVLVNVLPRLRLPAGMQPAGAVANYFLAASAVFMVYVNVVALQVALHPGLPLTSFIITGMLLLFLLVGNVLGKTRRNPWSGIRTPWTLASDSNWIATHRFAGRLWVGVSLAGIAALWLGVPMPILLPAVLLPLFGVPYLYSYLLFRNSGGGEAA